MLPLLLPTAQWPWAPSCWFDSHTIFLLTSPGWIHKLYRGICYPFPSPGCPSFLWSNQIEHLYWYHPTLTGCHFLWSGILHPEEWDQKWNHWPWSLRWHHLVPGSRCGTLHSCIAVMPHTTFDTPSCLQANQQIVWSHQWRYCVLMWTLSAFD